MVISVSSEEDDSKREIIKETTSEFSYIGGILCISLYQNFKWFIYGMIKKPK